MIDLPDEDFLRGTVLPGIIERMQSSRWYAEKGNGTPTYEVFDCLKINEIGLVYWIIETRIPGYRPSLYSVPIIIRESEPMVPDPLELRLQYLGKIIYVSDAIYSADFWEYIKKNMLTRKRLSAMRGGAIILDSEQQAVRLLHETVREARPVGAEQSNSSVVINNKLIFKMIRKIAPGNNPDYDVPSFLWANTPFRETPEPVGKFTYLFEGLSYHLGSLSFFYSSSTDMWKFFTGIFSEVLENDLRGNSHDLVMKLLRGCADLGETTSFLHSSLSKDSPLPDFKPSRISDSDITQWREEYLNIVKTFLKTWVLSDKYEEKEQWNRIVEDPKFVRILEDNSARIETLRGKLINKIRIHGDFHLGQVLQTEGKYMIIDFEGEPLHSLNYRNSKFCPIKDVAGMLRSISYAAEFSIRQTARKEKTLTFARKLLEEMRNEFLRGYLQAYDPGSPYLPPTFTDFQEILRFYEIEKTVYEALYELSNRPQFLSIPMGSLARLFQNAE